MSNSHPDTRGLGGLLFRFACSVVLRGGRGTADKCHWPVWGALAGFRPHWACPRSRRVCFHGLHCSGFRLLYREWALSCVHFPGLSRSGSGSRVLHKGADSVGPAFCAFPVVGAAQGTRSLTSAPSSGAGRLLPSPSPPQVLGAPHPVRLVSLLGSRSLAATLPVDVNHPESQEVRNWKPVCSLEGMPSLGPSLPLSGSCLLPPAGDGPVSRLGLLWYCSLLPLFCEWPAVPWVRVFRRLIFSRSLAIPQFKLLSHC